MLDTNVILRQVEMLSADLLESIPVLNEQIRKILAHLDLANIEDVFLVGAGDSLHASYAVKMAFETIPNVACHPIGAQEFIDYNSDWISQEVQKRSLVIAISASGSTQSVKHAIEKAKGKGFLTIALTGIPNSPVTKVADIALVAELQKQERSPGIRTYQASLLGLLLISIHLGENRNKINKEHASNLIRELLAISEYISEIVFEVNEKCSTIISLVAESQIISIVGSGPSYGTACFCAAKMMESVGMMSIGQDIEGWWHGVRFAYPVNMPIFIISPLGISSHKAILLAAGAKQLGRRVIVVNHKNDAEFSQYADLILSLKSGVREEFSPLLFHVFIHYVAYHIAKNSGRLLFQSNPPNFLHGVNT